MVLPEIIDELKDLKTHSPKLQKEASIALELSNRCKLLDLSLIDLPNISVDSLIIHIAEQHHMIVATNDKTLRRKLRAKHIPVIFLRKKAYLAIDGEIPF